jgi:uncharacterized protein YdcH (DUF465 family)
LLGALAESIHSTQIPCKTFTHTEEAHSMFPEYRELISRLKTSDAHFTHLFDQHNELDQTIKNMEARIVHGTHDEIENLKKEKLHLKDQLYVILRKASGI